MCFILVNIFLISIIMPKSTNIFFLVPFRFNGLYALGCIFFLLNIVLFIFNIVMISARFYLYPRTFKASFLHPTESLFIPAAIVSFGIILINISQYGVNMAGVGKWLEHCMIVLFWLDCGLAVAFSIGIYLIMSVLPPAYLQLPLTTKQVVHNHIYHLPDDTHLDLPLLRPFDYWPARRKSGTKGI